MRSGCMRISRRLPVMRETSSRSSTSRFMCATWRSITSRSARVPASPLRAIRCSAVAMGASGLRSSCPSMARNSSLLRPFLRAAQGLGGAREQGLALLCGAVAFDEASSSAWPVVASSAMPSGASPHRLAAPESAGGRLERVDRRDHVAREIPGDEGGQRQRGEQAGAHRAQHAVDAAVGVLRGDAGGPTQPQFCRRLKPVTLRMPSSVMVGPTPSAPPLSSRPAARAKAARPVWPGAGHPVQVLVEAPSPPRWAAAYCRSTTARMCSAGITADRTCTSSSPWRSTGTRTAKAGPCRCGPSVTVPRPAGGSPARAACFPGPPACESAGVQRRGRIQHHAPAGVGQHHGPPALAAADAAGQGVEFAPAPAGVHRTAPGSAARRRWPAVPNRRRWPGRATASAVSCIALAFAGEVGQHHGGDDGQRQQAAGGQQEQPEAQGAAGPGNSSSPDHVAHEAVGLGEAVVQAPGLTLSSRVIQYRRAQPSARMALRSHSIRAEARPRPPAAGVNRSSR